MGLFSTQEEKAKKIMDKYELSNLSKEYRNAVKNINTELLGSGLSEFGNLLAPDTNTALRVQIQYLNSIVQQNWIIIRQLDAINKNLENNKNNRNINELSTNGNSSLDNSLVNSIESKTDSKNIDETIDYEDEELPWELREDEDNIENK